MFGADHAAAPVELEAVVSGKLLKGLQTPPTRIKTETWKMFYIYTILQGKLKLSKITSAISIEPFSECSMGKIRGI